MKKVGVLFSAGVESTALIYHYLSQNHLVYPLYVSVKFPWEEAEKFWLRKIWYHFRSRFGRILPVRYIGGESPPKGRGIEIPLRNLTLTVFSSSILVRKGVFNLAVGSLGVYPFPDNNREYFERIEWLVSEGLGRKFRVETPFMGLEKWEVIRMFYGRAPFHLSFSCVSPVGREHCGRCPKCLERKEGFERAGVKDPTPYRSS